MHSNPLKEGSEATPWIDVVEADLGYAFYNGDNRRSGQRPAAAPGDEGCSLACRRGLHGPITPKGCSADSPLYTARGPRQPEGIPAISGFGVPARYVLLSQRERGTDWYFTNLGVELCLFRLDAEDEEFDWTWIDRRRDRTLPADSVLASAPSAWRNWVLEGEAALKVQAVRCATAGGVKCNSARGTGK